ncbi:membrane bound O-acyl transferase family-domain-containing protein [Fusarium tricinctum]|uniref:Membrane bound O-acyl transferase family-domain-containing protein n=1 Tax=Fusarium tricinctum TaxID=61284 RepID=A0A8K0RU69_9HYPO|nr:membrane bound O-acyl transferase family-domain-containing protein [Fusarium tricinctum]
MNAQAAFCLAATSQALSVFALGFTAPSDLLRPAIAVVVAWLTWLFNESIHDALQSRLHVALLSTGMWIQCLKTFDDLCLSKLSFDQEAGTSPKTAVGQLQFGVGNLWNMRGVGTSKQISQIPPWSYTNPLAPSRGRESTRHVRNAVVSFLILDVFANQPPPDLENMMSPRNEQLFSRLGEVNAEEAIFRFFASFGFWLNTFCVIQLINSLSSLLYLALNTYPVEMLPPIWGRLSDAYSIRRFWGNFWHQTLRRHLTSLSEFLVHKVLHMPKGFLARYCKLIVCFFISGALHFPADRALGISARESNVITYFLTTALVIMCEDGIQHISRRLEGNWRRYFGYAWVVFYMYLMTPSWGYPAARVVRPQDQLIPLSLTKQFRV